MHIARQMYVHGPEKTIAKTTGLAAPPSVSSNRRAAKYLFGYSGQYGTSAGYSARLDAIDRLAEQIDTIRAARPDDAKGDGDSSLRMAATMEATCVLGGCGVAFSGSATSVTLPEILDGTDTAASDSAPWTRAVSDIEDHLRAMATQCLVHRRQERFAEQGTKTNNAATPSPKRVPPAAAAAAAGTRAPSPPAPALDADSNSDSEWNFLSGREDAAGGSDCESDVSEFSDRGEARDEGPAAPADDDDETCFYCKGWKPSYHQTCGSSVCMMGGR